MVAKQRCRASNESSMELLSGTQTTQEHETTLPVGTDKKANK